MKLENIKEFEITINKIQLIFNNSIFNSEINRYEVKIELTIYKKEQNINTLFGIEIGFYDNYIDIVVIDWEGNIVKHKFFEYNSTHDLDNIINYINTNFE